MRSALTAPSPPDRFSHCPLFTAEQVKARRWAEGLHPAAAPGERGATGGSGDGGLTAVLEPATGRHAAPSLSSPREVPALSRPQDRHRAPHVALIAKPVCEGLGVTLSVQPGSESGSWNEPRGPRCPVLGGPHPRLSAHPCTEEAGGGPVLGRPRGGIPSLTKGCPRETG